MPPPASASTTPPDDLSTRLVPSNLSVRRVRDQDRHHSIPSATTFPVPTDPSLHVAPTPSWVLKGPNRHGPQPSTAHRLPERRSDRLPRTQRSQSGTSPPISPSLNSSRRKPPSITETTALSSPSGWLDKALASEMPYDPAQLREYVRIVSELAVDQSRRLHDADPDHTKPCPLWSEHHELSQSISAQQSRRRYEVCAFPGRQHPDHTCCRHHFQHRQGQQLTSEG